MGFVTTLSSALVLEEGLAGWLQPWLLLVDGWVLLTVSGVDSFDN